MHICLIASEFLGFGTAGGFGFATRSLGRNLVSRGHRVTVVIPQPVDLDLDRNTTEMGVDGITVRCYPRDQILRMGWLYRELDADIYHSQEPSLSTYVAQRAMPRSIPMWSRPGTLGIGTTGGLSSNIRRERESGCCVPPHSTRTL